MEHDESDLVGQPLEDVPKRDPDEDCNARRDDDDRFLGYCNRTAGWGTDGDSGRCRTHGQNGGAPEGNDNAEDNAGGSAPENNDNAEGNDGGAPEGNRNASTHDLYTDHNKFYQEVLDDGLRALCDNIYDGYLEKFRELNGAPVAGEKARLSQIAINQVKIIHGDNWAVDRPDDLDSGNPLIDRETRVKTTEHERHEEHRYRAATVIKAQQHLRKEDRKWLKEMGLLGADIDIAVDGQVDHDHEHSLDEDTQDLIEDLAADLKA